MSGGFAELGTVAEFINGAAFKPDDWNGSGARIIRIQNLTDADKPFNRTERKVEDQLYVRPGDLLVSWSATLGVFEWQGPDIAVLNQHIFRVVPNPQKIEKNYLRYALQRALQDMQRHLHGATMQHVNRGEFLATRFYLPKLDEQRRIADMLDRAEALRAKRRAALAQLDILTQSIFLDLFGDPASNPRSWPRFSLGDLLKTIDSGSSPICLDRPAVNGEWGVLKLGAVTWCEYDPMENKALPADVAANPEIEIKPGDLLFTRKNTYELVAACALVRATPPRRLMSDLIFRLQLRENAKIDSLFLQQLLVYPTKRKEIQRLAGGSAGSMPNISKERLRSALIEMPPLALQHEFGRRVAVIYRLKAEYRKGLAQLDAIFEALQCHAFRGEL